MAENSYLKMELDNWQKWWIQSQSNSVSEPEIKKISLTEVGVQCDMQPSSFEADLIAQMREQVDQAVQKEVLQHCSQLQDQIRDLEAHMMERENVTGLSETLDMETQTETLSGAASSLTSGDWVVVYGLVQTATLNLQCGQIVKYDRSKERYAIKFLMDGGIRLLRPENLHRVPASSVGT